MRIAFYAPLKAPDHPVPSGDRRMARAFLDLLRSSGHEVALASRFRSYDRTGDPGRQERLRAIGQRLAGRLAARPAPRPQLWFTYHLYHKAPDHLGPLVAARLGIPYVVAEASVAPRRAEGAWAQGYALSVAALAAADLVLAMTRLDRRELGRILPAPRLRLFPPFLDAEPFALARAGRERHRAQLAARHDLDPARPWLLTVAMMRADAKRESYRLLARALGHLRGPAWHHLIAGTGEAEGEVRSWLAPFGERVRFLGPLPAEDLPALYAACDLYAWPAVAEAYGMALLEAQAAGLPVVAGDEGGVADVVADGLTGCLTPPREPLAFASTLDGLLRDPGRCDRLGRTALARINARHGLPVARRRLAAALEKARRHHAARGAARAACASA